MRVDIDHAKRGELRGRGLRHVLVVCLADANQPVSLHELAKTVARRGVHLPGAPTKLISDSLRWEIRRGRVRRVRRGIYEFAGAPPSTMRWIRTRVSLLLGIVADATTQHTSEDLDAVKRPRFSAALMRVAALG
ncbi:MAG: hypothetical protein RIE08_11855 [Acidimicrobiales bacterium]